MEACRVAGGAVTDADYLALERLIGCEQLGLIASTEMLDRRIAHRHTGRPGERDLEAAEQLKRALQEAGAKR